MDSDPPANVGIAESLAAGDPAAYAALYARLARPLLRVAAAMLGGGAGEAEDVVHDVFVALARRREKLRRVEDLDAYVFASLRHAIAARLERRRTERRHLERIAAMRDEAVGPPEMAVDDRLADALATLPPEQREVILLKVDAALTFAQIAEVLRISPNTAASRYRYAIEKLRRCLEDRS
ncbi:MAG TPA: sigma-70 family RNA polymerase sigma factor [Tepidisphaeraceae bacterium]|jgi:RNA polymerase sigma-70 factor (ECF subfamily)